MDLPIVAIIGRPNVGKSTLFNCFVKAKKAIISDIPGTTRDQLMEKVTLSGEQNEEGEVTNFSFWLVDTAGLTNEKGDDLETQIQLQVESAIKNADLILFMIDGKEEMTFDDEEVVKKLRKSKVPLVFVANKLDDGKTDRVLELTRFGFGVPLPISAKNYTGVFDLEDAIETKLREAGFVETIAEEETNDIKLAFVGRPNVGKSSLMNAFIGQGRSVVSSVPGTTRDTIDTDFLWEKDGETHQFLFLDTAGLRRPGKTHSKGGKKDEKKSLEFWGSVRSADAIERSDVCALMIDALEGVTHQDLAIAGKIVEAGKGLIVCVNKFDLVREKARQEDESDERELDHVKMWGEELDDVRKNYWHYLSKEIPFLPWAPVLFFSAKTGKGIEDVLKSAVAIVKERQKRISTSELNAFVPEVYFGHVQPMAGNKKGTIKYLSQVDTNPPKFLFFVNNVKAFHFSYRRYLENKIREKYGFFGTPITIELRDSMDKFKGKGKGK
jgi:GTPase